MKDVRLKIIATLVSYALPFGYESAPSRTRTLWLIIRQQGFNVKRLAMYVGFSTRTLERRFRQQFRTTPKVWITHERMRLAPPLLAEGFSNKEVAASLRYTCESNFCRDFKRCFGYAPKSSGVFKRQQWCSCRVLKRNCRSLIKLRN